MNFLFWLNLLPKKGYELKNSPSKLFRLVKSRPFLEIIIELSTGIERRMTSNLPFTVRSSESLYKLDPFTKKEYLVAGSSRYEYIEEESNKSIVISQSERFAVIAHKVKVDLFYGNIFTKTKILIRESTVWSEYFLNHHKSPLPYGAIYASDASRLQSILSSNSFYHFLIEDLPDLLRIFSFDPNIEIIIWSEAPSYVKDALELAGIKYLQFQRFIYLERVIFAEKSKSLAPTEFALVQLKKFFRPEKIVVKDSEKLQIYVSRMRDSRSPWYEAELIKLLEQSGEWIVLDLSLISFREQIKYARLAKVWAGVHGAGLSWISMLDPGSIAIEIGPRSSDCFEQLASLAKVDFSRLSVDEREIQSPEFVFNEMNKILINQNFS